MLSAGDKVVPFRRPAPEPADSYLIVCVDGSAHVAGVCEHAAWLCGRLRSSIELLHVEEYERPPSGPDDQPLVIDRGPDLKEPDSVIDEACHRLAEVGAKAARLCHARGQFAPIAAGLAARADFLVMGRRGESHEDEKTAFGGNVLHMVRVCPAPVFLAAKTFLPIARALVVCDPQSDTSALSAFLSASSVLDGLSLELATATTADAEVVPANEDDPALELPRSLDACLSRDPYDLIVLSRRALLDERSPDALSPIARKLMTWRVSLLVY